MGQICGRDRGFRDKGYHFEWNIKGIQDVKVKSIIDNFLQY